MESDELSLSPHLKLEQASLYDKALDIHHGLLPIGVICMQALVQGTSFGKLSKLAIAHGASSSSLQELLGFLNTIGGLKRYRTLLGWSSACRIQVHHAFIGIRYATLSWRQPATTWWLGVGVCRATTWPILSASGVALLIYIAGFAPLLTVGGISAFGLSLFLLSLYLHELAHVYIVHKNGQTLHLLQHGLRLGLIHARLARKGEIASALSGPLAGMATCCGAALGTFALHWTLVALLALIMSTFHVLSLLPWYGDGASLLASIRLHRKQQSDEAPPQY